MSEFLKTFDKASTCLQKPETEIASTESNDNDFALHKEDIYENRNRQNR